MTSLPRATPESHGLHSSGVGAFLDAVEAKSFELHALTIFRRDALLVEAAWAPYSARRKHLLHSLTKSFVAAGIGSLVDDGRLSLDDRVVSFFQSELGPSSPGFLDELTVRHLLTMSSGQEHAPSGAAWRLISSSWVQEYFKEPVVRPPGLGFLYSSANSYMLSAIAQKVTGQPLVDYMVERFFAPLGITEFSWHACPNGVSSGGNGLSLAAIDVLKLGILYLKGGVWDGQRLLSEKWIRESTAPHMRDVTIGVFKDGQQVPTPGGHAESSIKWHDNYGYHWWAGPGGSYYGSGFFGQYLIVVPKLEAVIAINAAVSLDDADSLLDLVWEHLIPAMQAAPLPGDGGVERELVGRIESLRVTPVPKRTDSQLESTLSESTYAMIPNADGVEAMGLMFDGDTVVLTVHDGRGAHEVRAGLGCEIAGVTTLTGAYLHHSYEPGLTPVVASATWPAENELVIDITYVEMTFRDRIALLFEEDAKKVTYLRSSNVNSGPNRRPPIRGRLKASRAVRYHT